MAQWVSDGNVIDIDDLPLSKSMRLLDTDMGQQLMGIEVGDVVKTTTCVFPWGTVIAVIPVLPDLDDGVWELGACVYRVEDDEGNTALFLKEELTPR